MNQNGIWPKWHLAKRCDNINEEGTSKTSNDVISRKNVSFVTRNYETKFVF